MKYIIIEFVQVICFIIILYVVFHHKNNKHSQKYTKNLEQMIEVRTKELKNSNDKFINELEYARIIQQSLLPLKELKFGDTQFVSGYFPCDKLSGDFYDIYRVDEDSIGMYVLDVSGHGISAALMTMFCNNFIKSPERIIKKYRALKPHRNLSNFYEEFNKVNFPTEMYMVMMSASYNMQTKILTYCSGGLNSVPIVMRYDGQLEYLDKSSGFPICNMEDLFVPEYESARIQLYSGDRVLFYTDGLVESSYNPIFSVDELKALLRICKDDSLEELNQRIQSQIMLVEGNLIDDVSYFILQA